MHRNDSSLPLWRSLLFVPANNERFIDRAHTRGADAIILDLEDSVPALEKSVARGMLPAAAGKVSANGADVLVRINAGWRLAVRDLEAAINPAVNPAMGPTIAAIVVPKVCSGEQLAAICEVIGELELESGMPVGSTGLVALVESPVALPHLEAIANATPRLQAMILGSEDFSAATGMIPTGENLLFANQQVLFAARAAGLLPLGYVGSIAEYSDRDAFKHTIVQARKLGFRGGFCIHPSQVEAMNEGFSPSSQEIDKARGLINAYREAVAAGRGATEFEGRMVDAPVAARAEETLSMAQAIARKEEKPNQVKAALAFEEQ
jgi:citrate lyase subunit beta/citryl-CoA lyase